MSFVEMRVVGSLSRHYEIKSKARGVIGAILGICRGCFTIFAFIYSFVVPLKGIKLNSIAYSMMPMVHTSSEGCDRELSLRIISGAAYLRVNASFLSEIPPFANIPAMPKSTILIFLRARVEKRTFSSFKSLCIIFLLWHSWIAEIICNTISRACNSFSPFFSLTSYFSSPPSAYSITIIKSVLWTNVCCSFIMFLCFREFKHFASL